MATMGSYCKAYSMSEFRRYPGWHGEPLAKHDEAGGSPPEAADEEPYLFLQENLVVTDGIFLDENIVFDNVTPEWERFCKEELQFEVPDWATPEMMAPQTPPPPAASERSSA